KLSYAALATFGSTSKRYSVVSLKARCEVCGSSQSTLGLPSGFRRNDANFFSLSQWDTLCMRSTPPSNYKLKLEFGKLKMDISRLIPLESYDPQEIVDRIRHIEVSDDEHERPSSRQKPLTSIQLAQMMFDDISQVEFTNFGGIALEYLTLYREFSLCLGAFVVTQKDGSIDGAWYFPVYLRFFSFNEEIERLCTHHCCKAENAHSS
ncbi:unnamed protein product, partial [Didymodactylos carnosus]